MWYYHLQHESTDRLAVETDGDTYDLTSANEAVSSYRDLLTVADVVEQDVDDIARRLIDDADPIRLSPDAIREPVRPDEVWASGVTYEISEQARKRESGKPDIYVDVYDSDRPEIFFKATPSRTVGPDEKVGIRADSDWDVPEPELSLVLYRGEIVGYTVGNDMSSRALEGRNPLYLPQAKVFDRCAAIGPCVASPGTIADPHDLDLSMEIRRDDEPVFEGSASTAEMVRTCEELVETYCQHNAVAELAVLMTGTSLVPPDDFTLQAGDEITITIENVGTLTNEAVVV